MNSISLSLWPPNTGELLLAGAATLLQPLHCSARSLSSLYGNHGSQQALR